jgi:hypothetical protein
MTTALIVIGAWFAASPVFAVLTARLLFGRRAR